MYCRIGSEDDISEGAVEEALCEEEGMEEHMEPNNLGLWEIEVEPPSPLIEVSLTPDIFAYHELNQSVPSKDMTIIVRGQGDADSGAQRCLISEELFHNFGIPTFKRKNPMIPGINGSPLEVQGACLLRVFGSREPTALQESPPDLLRGEELGETWIYSLLVLHEVIGHRGGRLSQDCQGRCRTGGD